MPVSTANWEPHSIILTCPYCGCPVTSPFDKNRVDLDQSAIYYLVRDVHDSLTCEGAANRPGCGRPFRLPDVALELGRIT